MKSMKKPWVSPRSNSTFHIAPRAPRRWRWRKEGAEGVLPIGEEGQEGHGEEPHGNAGCRQPGHRFETEVGSRGARLDTPEQRGVHRGQGDIDDQVTLGGNGGE